MRYEGNKVADFRGTSCAMKEIRWLISEGPHVQLYCQEKSRVEMTQEIDVSLIDY